MKKTKVLFLTNNENTYPLYRWLINIGEDVILYSEKIDSVFLHKISPDVVVSYNYKFLITKDCIDCVSNIINLHISFLPWNRGSNPNFWSFVENTPKGVTIHKLEKGLDRGAIIFQREVFFDKNVETLRSSYEKLNNVICDLFKENWKIIKHGKYNVFSQKGQGSYHNNEDFLRITKEINFSYDDKIIELLNKIRGGLSRNSIFVNASSLYWRCSEFAA